MNEREWMNEYSMDIYVLYCIDYNLTSMDRGSRKVNLLITKSSPFSPDTLRYNADTALSTLCYPFPQYSK